jgi:hypothetical protein
MSSQPQSYIIPQTNKAWIKVPTNGGTYRIHENYNGVDVFQPYEIEATGTSTHTFVLPSPTVYHYPIGTSFSFSNASSGNIFIQAPDGTGIITLSNGEKQTLTCTGYGNSTANFQSTSANSGQNSVASGGTGVSSLPEGEAVIAHGTSAFSTLPLTTSGASNSLAKVDANGCVRACMLGTHTRYNTSQTFVATGPGEPLPNTAEFASNLTATMLLPPNGTMPQGRSCTFINTGTSSFTINDPFGPTLLAICYPGMSIRVTCGWPGSAISDAWQIEVAESFVLNQGIPVLATTSNNGLVEILPPNTVDTTYNMTNAWPKNTYGTPVGGNLIMILPDPTTIPIGQKYTFRLLPITIAHNAIYVKTHANQNQVVELFGNNTIPATYVEVTWDGNFWRNRWYGQGLTSVNDQGNGYNTD